MSILLDPVSFVCGIKDCSEEGVKENLRFYIGIKKANLG
jgi:hypothetical protein